MIFPGQRPKADMYCGAMLAIEFSKPLFASTASACINFGSRTLCNSSTLLEWSEHILGTMTVGCVSLTDRQLSFCWWIFYRMILSMIADKAVGIGAAVWFSQYQLESGDQNYQQGRSSVRKIRGGWIPKTAPLVKLQTSLLLHQKQTAMFFLDFATSWCRFFTSVLTKIIGFCCISSPTANQGKSTNHNMLNQRVMNIALLFL